METSSPHGTLNRYSRGKCRCPACKAVHSEAQERYRQKRLVRALLYGLPEGVEHGTSAYNNWGCRCQVCRAAVAEAERVRMARKKRSSGDT